MKMKTTCAAIALTLGLGAAANAAIVLPVGVTGPAGDASSSTAFLIDDSGLRDGADAATTVANGATLASAQATNHRLDDTGHLASWTLSGTTPAEFVFDLGADTSIGTIVLWQYGNDEGTGAAAKNNSTQNFELIFHTAAEGNSFGVETSEFSGVMAQAAGSTSAGNNAQTFQFASQTARYVELRIVDNYGGDRLGLGEVRFATEAVPEPSSAALLGLGGLALILRRRK